MAKAVTMRRPRLQGQLTGRAKEVSATEARRRTIRASALLVTRLERKLRKLKRDVRDTKKELRAARKEFFIHTQEPEIQL